ncbi:MAG: glycosyltransferase family 9 protein [Candidatus Riflebacteria bacterium]|nr:glycosyltransferase family 9 protein [Candidatus Riflebacteria bacterium]
MNCLPCYNAAMIFKQKIIAKNILSLFACLFFAKNIKIVRKTLLVIRLDGIGDYTLFRNFLQFLRSSKKYHDYDITLLGDKTWANISELLDKSYVNRFVWLDRNKFFKDPLYAVKFLHSLSNMSFETIISPVFTRNLFFTDTFAKIISAEHKIASYGDFTDITQSQKAVSNKWYNRLIMPTPGIKFEFDRNKEFFEALVQEKSEITRPFISLPENLPESEISKLLPKPYAVIFVGGTEPFRRWSEANYAQVALHLKQNHSLNIVLCGGPKDLNMDSPLTANKSLNAINLTGKTSLIELLYILKNAEAVISNETGSVHLACALSDKTKIVTVSNGNNLGRFAPYPALFKNYKAVFHPKVENDFDRLLKRDFTTPCYYDINEITPADVINAYETLSR